MKFCSVELKLGSEDVQISLNSVLREIHVLQYQVTVYFPEIKVCGNLYHFWHIKKRDRLHQPVPLVTNSNTLWNSPSLRINFGYLPLGLRY